LFRVVRGGEISGFLFYVFYLGDSEFSGVFDRCYEIFVVRESNLGDFAVVELEEGKSEAENQEGKEERRKRKEEGGEKREEDGGRKEGGRREEGEKGGKTKEERP
jgi:hypothetical protein